MADIDSEPANDNYDGSPTLWLGLLHRVPYEEVEITGYKRVPADYSLQPLQAVFHLIESAVVRGVGLWVDHEGGNPIYWKVCKPVPVQARTDFAVSLEVKSPEGFIYRPSGLLRALGVA